MKTSNVNHKQSRSSSFGTSLETSWVYLIKGSQEKKRELQYGHNVKLALAQETDLLSTITINKNTDSKKAISINEKSL
jgi:hypothetical protein